MTRPFLQPTSRVLPYVRGLEAGEPRFPMVLQQGPVSCREQEVLTSLLNRRTLGWRCGHNHGVVEQATDSLAL